MTTEKAYRVAVVGATGAVGQNIIKYLEEKPFNIEDIQLFSSKRSAGKKIEVNGEEITLQEATEDVFDGIDIAFFSAGGAVSEKLAPAAVKSGAVVVDNTSFYRMDEDVPLVVPEVNEEALKNHKGIVANPNCSTIQMVVALKPIQEKYGINRVIVSTYQAVSGAGLAAEDELRQQVKQYLAGEEMEANILPAGGDKKHYPIAFNALPQIDLFEANGYTKEEMKMINETKKIMNEPDLQVAATCVRLPVFSSHSESLFVETNTEGITVEEFKETIAQGEGIILEDDPSTQTYPTPLEAQEKKGVFVGRIRQDLDDPKGFHMWIVSDNLVKGAAWNTIQIAQSLVKNNLV
ncbi:MAG TPA: aspartate-semialdehyde dehydrogenase [Pseudogracilibacillus sp.]|nr:aspartate-semialdehyde dehydrogenase [Pseudogracilibacillus sp.]